MPKTMSAEEQRRMELRLLMPFPPVPDEDEKKHTVLKFAETNGRETSPSHWMLKRAGPPKDMIAHAMGFSKAIESATLAPHLKAVQYRRVLSGTAVTAFDKAHVSYRNQLCPRDNEGRPDMQQPPDLTQFNLDTCLKYFIAQ